MLKRMGLFLLVCLLAAPAGFCGEKDSEDGWIPLFDGESLDGWKKARENPGTWSVKDGMLVCDGARSHLFYDGAVENHNFKNFELKAEIKTTKGSNSGIYFHTEWQAMGWPNKGYEVQVNMTHSDNKKTGGLYGVRDVYEIPGKDGEWFTEHIIVRGKQVIIRVNGQTTVMYNEPEGGSGWSAGRKLSSGTIALQGHDPKSVVYYKSVKIKPLPDDAREKIRVGVVTGGHGFDRSTFFTLFEGYDDIEYMEEKQEDHSELFEDIDPWDFDVLVCYNMTQKISEKRRANFKKLLENGLGLVAFHHNMGAFQEWPEYKEIIGARYYLKPVERDGEKIPGSTYKHDIDMNITIASNRHPVTRGMEDFTIHDEGYKGLGFEEDNRVLLTTDHPASDKTVGWARRYGNARVIGIMLGHDGKAYKNPSLRKIIARSIRYTSGRMSRRGAGRGRR